MARVTFKGKPVRRFYADGTLAYTYIRVPVLKTIHCDMDAFRRHADYGGLANSSLFPNVLAHVRSDMFGGKDIVRLDAIPQGVTIDQSGFLATVSFDV